ncbi:hypothetical protein C8J57DRAFT_99518 [Mycena rebaudengoi]|nr:hypothetical protein C8J57DRAFT_99518 [Mycena rebaudengoi]
MLSPMKTKRVSSSDAPRSTNSSSGETLRYTLTHEESIPAFNACGIAFDTDIPNMARLLSHSLPLAILRRLIRHLSRPVTRSSWRVWVVICCGLSCVGHLADYANYIYVCSLCVASHWLPIVSAIHPAACPGYAELSSKLFDFSHCALQGGGRRFMIHVCCRGHFIIWTGCCAVRLTSS